MNKCIIDIGSNTVKLFIANIENNKVTPLCVKRRMTLLAKGLTNSGNLSLESRNMVIDNFEEYLNTCIDFGIDSKDILVTGTAAMRNAKNAQEFAQDLEQRFNLQKIQILSGQDEAEFSFLGAVMSAKGSDEGNYYVIDVGGGSLQVASGNKKAYHKGISIQKGCNYATEKFELDSKIAADKLFEVVNYYKSLDIDALSNNSDDFSALGIGGSVKIVQLMTKPNAADATLTLEELFQLAQLLSGMSLMDRYEWFCSIYPDDIYRKDSGLTQSRAKVILAGVCILIGVLENLKLKDITVSTTDAKDYLIRVM